MTTNLKVGDKFISHMGAGIVTITYIHKDLVHIHRKIQQDEISLTVLGVESNIACGLWTTINTTYKEEL